MTLWVVGCASGPTHTLRFHEQVPENLPASRVRFVTLARNGQRIGINPLPTLTEREVFEARLQPMDGGTGVLIRFDAHGANLLTEMTTRIRGQYLVVYFDKKPVAAMLVNRAVENGQFLLFGDLDEAAARELVAALNQSGGRRREAVDSRMAP